MRFALGGVPVELSSGDAAIAAHWDRLLARFPTPDPASAPTIVVRLEVNDRLPEPTGGGLVFAGEARALPADVNGLAVYQHDEGFELDFRVGAWVRLQRARDWRWKLEGVVRPETLHRGRLDDVLFTALAAPLRRHGTFLIHSFGAARDGRAVLLVGPSGSGKTTAGLQLLRRGWRLLGNDVVALKHVSNGVLAMPTPSLVGIRLRPDSDEYRLLAREGRWGEASPVAGLVFLDHSAAGPPEPERLGRAEALAHLLESSLDRWDEAMFGAHLELLAALAAQADGWRVRTAAAAQAAESLFAGWG